MGLFNLIKGINNIQQQTGVVKNARQQIFQLRDRLRNTPQFSNAFYSIVKTPDHPPMQITVDYTQGAFSSMDWDPRTGNYEPYITAKHFDPNIAYFESCAIFLLIQDCYPNVYDFPSRTTTQVEMGVPVELNMKNEFLNKKLIPASLPPQFSPSPAPQAHAASQADAAPQSNAAPKFCSNCGSALTAECAFCPSCGQKI